MSAARTFIGDSVAAQGYPGGVLQDPLRLPAPTAVPAALAQAEQALDATEDPAQVNALMSFAEAVRVIAERARLGTALCNEATCLKILAEIKLANLIDQGQREGRLARRGRPTRKGHKVLTLDDLGIDRQRLSEARSLRNRHTEDAVRELCTQATAADQVLSRQTFVRRVPHLYSNVSGQSEWYTPGPIVERARQVMGGIDLDPATHPIAQEWVKADRFYTAETDGLNPANPWFGRVLLNPPYSVPILRRFIDRLFAEYRAGAASQAIVISNNIPETDVGQRLLADASAVCFPRRRLRFWTSRDQEITSGSPVTSQMITYLGDRQAEFETGFADLGAVVGPRP
jgi:ParB family chromosome partitioning protein